MRLQLKWVSGLLLLSGPRKKAKTHHGEHLIKTKDGTKHFMRTLRAVPAEMLRDFANGEKWREEKARGRARWHGSSVHNNTIQNIIIIIAVKALATSSGGGGQKQLVRCACNTRFKWWCSCLPLISPHFLSFLVPPSPSIGTEWRKITTDIYSIPPDLEFIVIQTTLFCLLQAKQFSISNARLYRPIYHLSRSGNNL